MCAKKIVIFVPVICFVLLASASPLDANERKVGLGGKLGLDISGQATEFPFGENLVARSKIDVSVGAVASVDVYEASTTTPRLSFALQSEVLFVARGTNIERDGMTVGAYNLRYIEIPILARVEFPVASHVTSHLSEIAPYLILGPELGILVSAELENSRGETFDSKEGLEAIDLGLIFGAGVSVDVAAARGAFALEARYDLGLMDINATGMGGYVKNRAFALMLGYQYEL